MMNGTSHLHLALEDRLARFLRTEAALVFSAGFLANLGVLTGLATRDTLFLCDKLNHASICDGLAVSAGSCLRFAHNDPEALERRLRKLPPDGDKWVVLEGVHSMLGDVAPLPDFVAVARRHGARIILDDAHGVGVLGADGRGTTHLFGLDGEVDLIVGTFSKSFASYGGFAAGSRELIEHLRYLSRAFVFTAALPPANVATVSAVLELLENGAGLVEKLRENTLDMAERLRAAGLLRTLPPAAIIPLAVGENDLNWRAWRLLFEAGVYTNANNATRLFLARRGGREVGRIATTICRAHNAHHGERAAFFGFFESAPEPAVAAQMETCNGVYLSGVATMLIGNCRLRRRRLRPADTADGDERLDLAGTDP